MKKEIICINCPLGCRMTVTLKDNLTTEISGNTCKLGKEHALQEATLPMRVLTGNMCAHGCTTPFSVKTNRPIPKSMLLQCAAELKKHRPKLPIKRGNIIISNILNTGADIIATSDLYL